MFLKIVTLAEGVSAGLFLAVEWKYMYMLAKASDIFTSHLTSNQ